MREYDEKSAPNDATANQKDYHSPQLFVYGHIREITRGIGVIGDNDNIVGKTGIG
jgi:hypothetical protein